jgi:metal-sulfur cluster biosynthetic enzyme
VAYNVSSEFPPGYDGTAILKRLDLVLDPELDESILRLGFVRSVQVRDSQAVVMLQLPTSWCATNFAYMMADDARQALLEVEGIQRVTVRLGDHCAAEEIEAAVNDGRPFATAFPGMGAADLSALRLTFLRKGFLVRQERLLRSLRAAGCSSAMICGLRLWDVSVRDGIVLAELSGAAPVEIGPAEVLRHYLDRRAELGLDCTCSAPLIVDTEGRPLPAEQLERHYQDARMVRVSLEANGSFCRAMLAGRRADAANLSSRAIGGGVHVQP